MKLELKHLAPYLPYDLKVKYTNKYNHSQIITLVGVMNHITKGKDIQVELCNKNLIHFFSKIEGVKPILRPLSDLTKEIEVNGERFVPLVEIIKYLNFKFLRYEIKDNSLDVVFDNKLQTKERFWFSNFKGTSFYCSNMNKLMYKDIYGAINKLLEWHFDIFGLIEKGLAIDINTSPQSSE